jgi:tRNA pseudouridine synthase 9
VGRGGIDIRPSDLREAPAPPAHLKDLIATSGSPESLAKSEADAVSAEAPKLLPRETGDDIGMGSPVPLSQQAVEVITKLRNMKVRRKINKKMTEMTTLI